MDGKKDAPRRYDDYKAWAAGLVCGFLVAAIIGFATGNPAVFVGFGISIGIVFGIVFHSADFDRVFRR